MKLFLASLASETLDLALPLLPDEPQIISTLQGQSLRVS